MIMNISDIHQKKTHAISLLSGKKGVLVALSGGVDSAVLLALAAEALPKEQVVAVTAISETNSSLELEQAGRIAQILGVAHYTIETEELSNPEFVANPRNRCYLCKKEMLQKFALLASELGFDTIAVGATLSDLSEHRPGHQATLEAGAIMPMLDAGLTKEDIRQIAREAGLPVWDSPSSACLASRFPYGTAITHAGLTRIAEVELAVRALGLHQVRCRDHGTVGRLEILPSEWAKVDQCIREELSRIMHRAGYTYCALDLDGYRAGAMDEAEEE